LSATGLLFIAACTKHNAEDDYPVPVVCNTENVTFSQVVKPIIDAKCVGCHSGFSQYAGIAGAATSGKLLPAINHTGTYPMPKDQPKLDDCTIAKITKWVNEGAINN
jgi:hypothetical protein